MDNLIKNHNTLLQAQLAKAEADLQAVRDQNRELYNEFKSNVKVEDFDFTSLYHKYVNDKKLDLINENRRLLQSTQQDPSQIKARFVPIFIENIDHKVQTEKEEKYHSDIKSKEEKIRDYEQLLQNQQDTFKKQLLQYRSEISVLNTQIQDLKGNIRVYVRIRPAIGNEKVTENSIQVGDDIKTISLGDKTYKFDHIFGEHDQQEDVFSEIQGLVKSCVDGFNVCVFAYGATGSGKTHTMEGDQKKKDGIIHQAVRQIFTDQQQALSSIIGIKASFFEIYNEQIFDLLRTGQPKSLDLRLNRSDAQKDDVFIADIIQVQVESEADLVPLFALASKNRSVGETQSNIRSSRSHSVFQLKIESQDQKTLKKYHSTLNLADLAGSERLQQSGAQGERLKETQNINKSLSHLGLVIQALHNRESHIPYRNSKLTHVFSNVLGGSAKVLMFVNIASTEEQLAESLCSLRFAQMVNSVNLGVAQRKGR